MKRLKIKKARHPPLLVDNTEEHCCCCVAQSCLTQRPHGWRPPGSPSVVSNSARPHRQQPTRLPRPWDSPGKNTGVGCHRLLQCVKVKSESEVTQSCPTLSGPTDGARQAPRPWDSAGKNTGVGCHRLLQCMKVKSEREVTQSCPTLSDPHGLQSTRLLRPWDSPGKSTGVGCHCLL